MIKNYIFVLIVSVYFGASLATGEESGTCIKSEQELISLLNAGPVEEGQEQFLSTLKKYIESVHAGDITLNKDVILKASKYAYFIGDQLIREESRAIILELIGEFALQDEICLEAKRICEGEIEIDVISDKELGKARSEFESKALDYIEILMQPTSRTITRREVNKKIEYLLGIEYIDCQFRAMCIKVRYMLQNMNLTEEETLMSLLNSLKGEVENKFDEYEYDEVIRSVRLSIEARRLSGMESQLVYELESFLNETVPVSERCQ